MTLKDTWKSCLLNWLIKKETTWKRSNINQNEWRLYTLVI